MELNRDNYYTPEADMEYMSCSQFQSFQACEAAALAKLQGRWLEEPSEAFIVGNYFHTAMESEEAHLQFCDENFHAIYKTKVIKGKGGLPDMEVITGKKAPYEQADVMLAAAHNDALIQSLIDMPGENEKIMTGLIWGVPWRIRLDKYVENGRMIIDWKTVASIGELKWSDKYREKVTFIEAYDYMMRAAVYSEVEKQNAGSEEDPNFVIVAISKQDPPDKEVLLLNHRTRYDFELELIGKKLPYFQAIKEGRMKPKRCGTCAYCRSTKKLYEIRPYYSLMPEYRGDPEDDYAAEFGTGEAVADSPEERDMEPVSSMSEPDKLGETLGRDVDAVRS